MAIEKRVEVHIIVSKYIFPYVVLVNTDPTERLFKSGYMPEWSYTKIVIRFPHNSADITRSTVLGHLSSYIRQ
jgi:hypothetical protein